ncbi:putative transmembrane efflux protein [Pseudonocardia sp. Ae356_Ps1]|nr:putative transmembrane efflux protein [Pseudonocardia sp. Ae356_Ps1]
MSETLHVESARRDRDTPHPRRHVVFAVVSVALLMFSQDQTAVATALTTVSGDLGVDLAWTGWIVTIYAVGQILALPLGGRLADRFGSRRTFLVSVAAFTVLSGLCAVAGAIGPLIGLRFLQGVAGGVMLPAANGIVAHHYGRDRDRALAAFTSVFPIGAILGPLVGGLILTTWSWHAIFLVNAPLGGRRGRRRRTDRAGPAAPPSGRRRRPRDRAAPGHARRRDGGDHRAVRSRPDTRGAAADAGRGARRRRRRVRVRPARMAPGGRRRAVAAPRRARARDHERHQRPLRSGGDRLLGAAPALRADALRARAVRRRRAAHRARGRDDRVVRGVGRAAPAHRSPATAARRDGRHRARAAAQRGTGRGCHTRGLAARRGDGARHRHGPDRPGGEQRRHAPGPGRRHRGRRAPDHVPADRRDRGGGRDDGGDRRLRHTGYGGGDRDRGAGRAARGRHTARGAHPQPARPVVTVRPSGGSGSGDGRGSSLR